jgi:hypothetical protein
LGKGGDTMHAVCGTLIKYLGAESAFPCALHLLGLAALPAMSISHRTWLPPWHHHQGSILPPPPPPPPAVNLMASGLTMPMLSTTPAGRRPLGSRHPGRPHRAALRRAPEPAPGGDSAAQGRRALARTRGLPQHHQHPVSALVQVAQPLPVLCGGPCAVGHHPDVTAGRCCIFLMLPCFCCWGCQLCIQVYIWRELSIPHAAEACAHTHVPAS